MFRSPYFNFSQGISISFRYDGWIAVPSDNSGILAEFEKNQPLDILPR